MAESCARSVAALDAVVDRIHHRLRQPASLIEWWYTPANGWRTSDMGGDIGDV